MKSGICPKCGSDEIYVGIPKYRRNNAILLKVAWTNTYAFVQYYVCSACSYTESYIADKESMKRIHEEFQPLKKAKRKNEG